MPDGEIGLVYIYKYIYIYAYLAMHRFVLAVRYFCATLGGLLNMPYNSF